MTRADQESLVALYSAVCARSLDELCNLMLARIATGVFDESDAEFLRGASQEVLKHTHNLQVEAALAELPAQKDLH